MTAITNFTGYHGVYPRSYPAGTAVQNATGSTEDLPPAQKEEAQKAARSTAEILAGYDLRNISPQEIDQLGNELLENGDESGIALDLLTHGAGFQSHLRDLSRDILGDRSHGAWVDGAAEASENSTQKFDLIAKIEEQVQFSQRMGDSRSAEYLEDFLARIQKYEATADRSATLPRFADATQSVLLNLQEVKQV